MVVYSKTTEFFPSPPFVLDLDGKILILLALSFNDNVSDLDDSPVLLMLSYLSFSCSYQHSSRMPHASFVIALRLNLTQPKPSNHCDHLPLKFSDNSTSKLKFKIGVQTPMLPLLSIIPSFIRIILKILEHKFSLRMTMEQIKYTSKSFAAHHTNRNIKKQITHDIIIECVCTHQRYRSRFTF
ncbi:hypothetical protein CFP56_032268, partial [Quercus suber]